MISCFGKQDDEMPNKWLNEKGIDINKQKHKVSNWSEYNAALKRRGDIEVWLSQEGLLPYCDLRDTKEIESVTSISELGFNHQQQIDLLKECQEVLLKIQSKDLQSDINFCPKCGTKLKLAGNILSEFDSIFSDHKVSVKRKKCCNKDCGWTNVPSISALFGTNCHPDLSKLQIELACNHTYREAAKIMHSISYYSRKVNNHIHIHRTVETVGNYISKNQLNDIPSDVPSSEELISQVDGGHLKSKDDGLRTFEALTSVIYNPKNVRYPTKDEKQLLDGIVEKLKIWPDLTSGDFNLSNFHRNRHP